MTGSSVLVHLAAGLGDVVLATPLILTLSRHGFSVDLLIDADYPGTADLFADWGAVRTVYNGSASCRPSRRHDILIPAVPPFYWARYAHAYRRRSDCVGRPQDALFYRDQHAYYLEFARRLGCDVREPPYYFVPRPSASVPDVDAGTLVLAPGCKTGVMSAKRWPYFPALAELFDDVLLVGTEDDLRNYDGTPMRFPSHVRSAVGRLSLRDVAGVVAGAGAVVANDSGLGHLAGAVGAPTILLFGPTPDRTLGRLPPNVTVLRHDLGCAPCWNSARFRACSGRIDCLGRLRRESVARVVERAFHQHQAVE